jgi:hypothetical protein
MRTRRLTLLVPLTVVIGLLIAATGSASPNSASVTASASQEAPADDAAALPSRVANAVHRTEISLDAASASLDSGDKVGATASLNGVRLNIYRADKAARAQMNAAPVDPEEPPEDAPDAPEAAVMPADSVVAVLGLDQTIVTSIAGLFDGKQGAVLTPLSSSLFAAMNTRDKLLASVIALDPEGAGVDYADVMADTVAGYDDEVANLTEALAVDQLSAGGKKVLTAALAQSKATQAKVTAAFGGGE